MEQASSKVSTPKHFNIKINDEHYKVGVAEMTGRDIAALAGILEGNQIFLEVPGPADDTPVGLDEVVQLKSGMRFYDVPVGNLG